jgi:iron complex transport system substrate-binding protein
MQVCQNSQVKKLGQFTLAIITVVVLAGCATSNSSSNSQETQVRIIAAAAGSAEILKELGLGNEIVGVDERNSISHNSMKVTTGHAFNFEVVASLKPTVVILDSLTDSREVEKKFQDLKVSIVNLPTAENIEQIYTKYKILGKHFEREELAKQASEALRTKFEKVPKGNKSLRIVFLYLRGTNSIYLVGGKGSGADSLIEKIGSVDVGAQILDSPFTPLTAEVMKQLNPEAILLMSKGLESVGGFEGLRKLPGLEKSIAIKKKQIILIDDRKLLDFGPETLNVLEEMTKQSRRFQ